MRQTFLQQDLNPGSYLLVPISTGESLNFKMNQKPVVNLFTISNPKIKAAVNEIFWRFDQQLSGLLLFSEIKAFYKVLSVELNESDFIFITDKFGKRNLDTGENEGITQNGFFKFFFYSFIEGKEDEQIIFFFDKFGYDSNLFSYRTRSFIISCHSQKSIIIKMKDALLENLDNFVYQLLLIKKGRKLDKFRIAEDLKTKILCFQYLNELIYKKN